MSLAKPIAHESAEMAVVGAMIVKSDSHIALAEGHGINSGMFTLPSCKIVFEALCKMKSEEVEIDQITIVAELKTGNRLEAIGGPEAIFAITATVRGGGANFETHCKVVREFYVKRQIAQDLTRIESDALDGATPEELLEKVKSSLDGNSAALMAKSDRVGANEAAKLFLEEYQERIERNSSPGQLTGIHALDQVGGGMKPGELWIISGKTSGGKSVLSLQMMHEAIKDGKHVLIFSLEMSVSEVAGRLVSGMGKIPMQDIMNPLEGGKPNIGDLERIKKGMRYISGKNISFFDRAGMTADWICAQSEIYAESHNIETILIDYIQLCEGSHAKGQSREQEIAKMSRQFKQLAKKVKATVITPSQLNDDGRLRESRAIGHDADVVLKIEEEGIVVEKYRSAKRGQTLNLEMNGSLQRFETSFNQKNQ